MLSLTHECYRGICKYVEMTHLYLLHVEALEDGVDLFHEKRSMRG